MKKLALLILISTLPLSSPLPSHGEFFRDIIITSPSAIWTDSRAYSSLSDAISAIGSREQDLYIAREETVTSLTIPSNIRLHFLRSGSIKNTGTLTIQTTSINANHQIFTGTGAVNFAPGTEVKSSWFADLETAISQTSNDTCTLLITKPDTITNSVAVGDNVILKWNSPHLITVLNGHTLSNITEIQAPRAQLFASTGTITASPSLRSDVYAEWFDNTFSVAGLTRALTFIGSNNRNLILSSGPWIVTVNLTIPHNVALKILPGGSIQLNAALTVEGQLEAPELPIFSGSGTLSIYRSSICPEWFGAVGDGITDDSSAMQRAITVASATGSGVVQLSSRSYLFKDLLIPTGVSIKGRGIDVTTIYADSTGASGPGTFNASAPWRHQVFEGFSMTHASATGSNISFFHSQYGATSCQWRNFRLYAKSGVTQHGIWLQGYRYVGGSLVANNNLYNNLFENFRIGTLNSRISDGIAFYLDGSDTTNTRANANTIQDGVADGFDYGIKLWGNGNLVQRVTFNGSLDCIWLAGNTSTTGNTIVGCYFDAAVTRYFLRLESTTTSTTAEHVMAEVIGYTSMKTTRVYATNTAGGVTPLVSLVGRDRSSLTRLGGTLENGFLQIYGGVSRDYNSGGFAASGSEYATAAQLVSKYGGASSYISSHGASEYRLVRKLAPPYSRSFLTVLTTDQYGVTKQYSAKLTKSFTGSDVDPATDEITFGPSLDFTSGAINTVSDTITIPGHGLVTGDKLALGLRSGTMFSRANPVPESLDGIEIEVSYESFYYAIVVDSNTIKLADTVAKAATGAAVDLTDPGSGSFSLTKEADMHGLYTGQKMTFEASSPPGGLADKATYYIILSGYNRIRLASTLDNAINGVYTDITSAGSGGTLHGGCPADSITPSGTSYTVYNASVTANSTILLQPGNSATNTFEKAHGQPYITVANGYFTIASDGASWTGNEAYRYFVFGR